MEQHFLTHPGKLEVLVAAAGISAADRVLELGSGAGTVAAALPPCAMTLVERDAGLAAGLRARFPNAVVLQGDALEVIGNCPAEVILSNLPHQLTARVVARLAHTLFERAVIAVHDDDALADLRSLSGGTLQFTSLITLDEADFTPPQPFKSKLVQVTREQASG